MALNTAHINTILGENSVTRRYFIGTYASCEITCLPKRKKYSFVTNTKNHLSRGAHWNAWFVKDNKVYFFDSFARSPMDSTFPHHYADIVRKFSTFYYFNKQLQDFSSYTCGYFCIHFIYNMSLGLNIMNLKSEYSSNFKENDVIVLKIIKSLL